MVFYISSNKQNPIIIATLNELDIPVENRMVHDHINFIKFVKGNLQQLQVEHLIIDLSALDDLDEDILSGIKMIRTMYENTKIIIISHDRRAGDKLLADIFSLGIYNIIATFDFVNIKTELELCLKNGKSFKEALAFKETKTVASIGKVELKAVNKVSIGIAGAQARIGCTHASIVLAATLRKMGYMVALMEMNTSSCFQKIRMLYNLKLNDALYFSLDGVDYYPDMDKLKLKLTTERTYNFIIFDYGNYKDMDFDFYMRNHEHIIVAGTKAWELDYVNEILGLIDNDTLERITFFFNLTDKSSEKTVKKEMKNSGAANMKIFFLDYYPDVFNTFNFPNVKNILSDYLPDVPKKKRFSFFGKK